jgi:riboflavin synthase
MFTGIVSAVGAVRGSAPRDGGLDLAIGCPWTDVELGESIAVDGACLTVTAVVPGEFRVHVVRTSLERTKFGTALPERVNLERALRAGDRLGGHLVQGHVDGVGTVERVSEQQDARLLDLRVPDEVAAVSIPLGSVTVDGVSLTVNAIPAHGRVQVSLIPFTLQHTTLSERRAGDPVHLEGDTIGKYVRAFIRP